MSSQRPTRALVSTAPPVPIRPAKSIEDSNRTRRPSQSYSRSTTVEYRPRPAGVKSCYQKSYIPDKIAIDPSLRRVALSAYAEAM